MSNKTNTTAPSLKVLSEDKEHETGVSKVTTFRIDPDTVTFEEGFNVRSHDDTWEAHVDRLYVAMKGGAAIPPIDVRVHAGVILCVEGHARTIAAQRLKKEVPEYTLEARNFRGNETERTLHMLGTGSGQKPLTPLEQGIGFFRLLKYGMTAQQIADKLGLSKQTIDNGLTLAEAPVEVQDMVRQGAISSTTAREAIKQGTEGVEALKVAVAAEKANPTKTKKGKKKKVAAKKLKGTAAEKKTTPKKAKKINAKLKTVHEWNQELGMSVACVSNPLTEYTKSAFLALASLPASPSPVPNIGENDILVKVTKTTAQAVMEFLRANAPDEAAEVKEFAGLLEMALM